MNNILIIVKELYCGGVERVAANLASELSEKYNVSVAYYHSSEQNHPVGEGYQVYQLGERDDGKQNPIYLMFFFAKLIPKLRRLKRELNIDLAFSMMPGPSLINILSRGGEHIVCSERSNPKKEKRKSFFPLVQWIYQKADMVIFQSEQIRHLFPERVQKKSCILKNPVEIPKAASEKRAHRIVTMGRLDEQKNHELLIRSFAIFHQEHPEYSLSIYGEGWLRDKLQDLIQELSLKKSVMLEGNYNNVHEKIQDAEMFVLSSDYEGLSNALLEAMAMGIASISTRCEGSTDVIRDGENGLLVDIGDEEGLAKAMSLLSENEALRKQLEKQAMEDIKAFDKKHVAKEWEQVFLSVEGASKE